MTDDLENWFGAAGAHAAGTPRPDLVHNYCGRAALVERPHMHLAGKTEIFCTVCGWIIHELHVTKATTPAADVSPLFGSQP